MPITVGSPELDAIADQVAAEYAAEKAAPALFQAEIAEAKRWQADIVKNRKKAQASVGVCLASAVGGGLAWSTHWGPMIASTGLVIGAIFLLWIYDSYGREKNWRRREELANEGLSRLKMKEAAN
jgi:hypothetical protein